MATLRSPTLGVMRLANAFQPYVVALSLALVTLLRPSPAAAADRVGSSGRRKLRSLATRTKSSTAPTSIVPCMGHIVPRATGFRRDYLMEYEPQEKGTRPWRKSSPSSSRDPRV